MVWGMQGINKCETWLSHWTMVYWVNKQTFEQAVRLVNPMGPVGRGSGTYAFKRFKYGQTLISPQRAEWKIGWDWVKCEKRVPGIVFVKGSSLVSTKSRLKVIMICYFSLCFVFCFCLFWNSTWSSFSLVAVTLFMTPCSTEAVFPQHSSNVHMENATGTLNILPGATLCCVA